MSEYKVYKHSVQGYEAIKTGFSWPALLFIWIWAFIKKLWVHGAILIFATMLGQIILVNVNDWTRGNYDIPMIVNILIGILFFLCIFAPSIVAGMYGNKWREVSMLARGYKLIQTVEAGAPDGAIAIVNESDKG